MPDYGLSKRRIEHLLPANGTNVTIDNPTLNFAETGCDQGQCEGANVTVTATAS